MLKMNQKHNKIHMCDCFVCGVSEIQLLTFWIITQAILPTV